MWGHQSVATHNASVRAHWAVLDQNMQIITHPLRQAGYPYSLHSKHGKFCFVVLPLSRKMKSWIPPFQWLKLAAIYCCCIEWNILGKLHQYHNCGWCPGSFYCLVIISIILAGCNMDILNFISCEFQQPAFQCQGTKCKYILLDSAQLVLAYFTWLAGADEAVHSKNGSGEDNVTVRLPFKVNLSELM